MKPPQPGQGRAVLFAPDVGGELLKTGSDQAEATCQWGPSRTPGPTPCTGIRPGGVLIIFVTLEEFRFASTLRKLADEGRHGLGAKV